MSDYSTSFIFVRIPESIGPLDRGDRYEDPLDDLLSEAGIGEVSGGGTGLSEQGPDGQRQIEYCGIDVDVTDLDAGLHLLRLQLPLLGAPRGTELHYKRDGLALKDAFLDAAWVIGAAREP